uniref:Malate dehydrogenase n=1 Tax=Pyrodinium bahamense TaxID=73915 RepID=A0A7S0B6Z7_9DINO
MAADETVRMTLPACRDLCKRALEASGLCPASAGHVADAITAAERDEARSHGLFRLPGFCRSLRSGRVPGDAIPQVHDRGPGVVHVDAAGVFSPVAFTAGLPVLVEKAWRQGVAVLSIANSLHFSALWWEAEILAAEGLIALVFVNSLAFMAPHGGSKRVFGTNPMAFAWPRAADLVPLVWDQSSSVMSRGDMQLALLGGREIPLGAAINAEGNPTTNPAEGLAGAQCPFGGAKGSNIAIMVELLAAGLTGGTLSADTPVPSEANHPGGAPTENGELIIAINPAHFPGDTALAAERVCERVLGQAASLARLPSARRHAARERTATAGIYVARPLYDTIQTFLQPVATAPRFEPVFEN